MRRSRLIGGELRRVRYKDYGPLPRDSDLLVQVPGINDWRHANPTATRRLHILAAESFERMAWAIKRGLGIELRIASGWRRHRWQSKAHYERYIAEKYPKGDGRRWLAYKSNHETGLAMDIGVGGLWPSKKSRAKQREQPLHRWMVEHAAIYGWVPYKAEPWHWEYPVTTEEWRTGMAAPSGIVTPLDEEMTVSFDVCEDEDEDDVCEDEDDIELRGE